MRPFAGLVGILLWAVQGNAQVMTPGYNFALDPPITSFTDARIVRAAGEGVLPFVARATMALNRATYHPAATPDDWSGTVRKAAQRDPDLFSLGLLALEYARTAQCGERAFLLADVLSRNGIWAAPYGIGGHVITIVRIGERTYAADVDFGIPPFVVDLKDGEQMRRAATIVYGEKNAAVVEMYASTVDNDWYYSLPKLQEIAQRQREAIGLTQ